MSSVKEIGALSGIKVIDLTRVLSGPFCTMLLADMGAEVIKIEPPKGDNVRNQGDMVDGYSSYFAQFNRNKKSVILDLYVEAEKDILKLIYQLDKVKNKIQDKKVIKVINVQDKIINIITH